MFSVTEVPLNIYSTGVHSFKDSLHDFLEFLMNKDLMHLMIATILSSNINEITKVFIEEIVTPIFKAIVSSDNEKQFEQYRLNIFGIDFGIGRIISLLLRVSIILYFAYVFIIYFPKLVKQYFAK